jgi:co-chaperonin GroES (HSP10)
MRSVNSRMLVRLKPRKKMFGSKMVNTDIRTPETKSGIILQGGNSFNPEMYVPTEGIVEMSCMPEVKVGDTVHMEYFGVIINLGKWWNEASESDERNMVLRETKKGITCSVFVKSQYLYYVENKEGKLKMLNGYNIIEPVYLERSVLVIIPTAKTSYAHCTYGDYAGKMVVFHRNADMGMTAHKRTPVNNKYIEGTIEGVSVMPTENRVCIIPDKAKVFNEFGLMIPPEHRKVPNRGTVESVGSKVTKIKPGDVVCYSPQGTTVVAAASGVRLLIKDSRIELILDE